MALTPPVVVNLGVAKSGTVSLFEYFECNGWRATHDTDCGWNRCSTALSKWLTMNVSKTSPEDVFRDAMGGARVYAELNAARECFFPQADHVDQLVRSLPGACFVLTSRPPERWRASMLSYHAPGKRHSLAVEMLRSCASRGRQPREHTELERWYTAHLERARRAMMAAKCALEVPIEQPVAEVGALLARRFPGTNATCWSHSHATV